MFPKSKKGLNWCYVCDTTNIIVTAIAVILSLAALLGVYYSHVLSTGLTFGTTSGSMSIISLAISLFLLKKALSVCKCQCALPTKK